MFGEINYDTFDRLIEAYATVVAYQERLPRLEQDITSTAEAITATPPSLDDFRLFFANRSGVKEETIRRMAWMSQHLCGGRAWCVGQKIILRRKRETQVISPLLQQLKRLGYQVDNRPLEGFGDLWTQLDREKHERVDVMAVNQRTGELLLIKGQRYSRTLKVSKRLWDSPPQATLFRQENRFLHNVLGEGNAVRSLLFARDLLHQCCPTLSVRPLFLVLSDDSASWNFQAFDLSAERFSSITDRRTSLDAYPTAFTHFDFASHLDADGDFFGTLPSLSGQDVLRAAPADRPTRCLMVMNELWDRQVGRKERLASHSQGILARAVEERYGIEYPVDLYRHDFEDCLERGRFLQRSFVKPSQFALTPKGVARLFLIRRRCNPLSVTSAPMLMDAVERQAKLWAEAPVL
jgi:hypothetical protein